MLLAEMQLRDGRLYRSCGQYQTALSLHAWLDDEWQELLLQAAGDALCASSGGIEARLKIEGNAYTLDFQSKHPTRLLLRLEVPEAIEPFHVISGCIFGDNNMLHSLGHGPVLTATHPELSLIHI